MVMVCVSGQPSGTGCWTGSCSNHLCFFSYLLLRDVFILSGTTCGWPERLGLAAVSAGRAGTLHLAVFESHDIGAWCSRCLLLSSIALFLFATLNIFIIAGELLYSQLAFDILCLVYYWLLEFWNFYFRYFDNFRIRGYVSHRWCLAPWIFTITVSENVSCQIRLFLIRL